jgi:hypothetical protein
MLFSLFYMVLRSVLRLAPAGDERDREAEILVLRHQVKVLNRKACRPNLSRLDKLFLAAVSRILPKERGQASSSRRPPCSAGIASSSAASGPTGPNEREGRPSILRYANS